MGDGQMWFGTRGNMRWINEPSIDYDASRRGFSNTVELLNGGVVQMNSMSSHQSLNLSWNYQTRADARKITDYADGMFGDPVMYMTYPFAMDANVLPKGWAFPGSVVTDGYSLVNNSDTLRRPTAVPTSTNPNGYPSVSASYNVPSPASVTKSIWVPIPPGHTAWIGVAGTAGSGGRVTVRQTNGTGYTGAAVNTIFKSVQDPQWWEASIPASATVDGIEIKLGGTGSMVLTGMMVQVLPNGRIPVADGFKSGEGMAGARFAGKPSVTHYNAAMDMVGVSATLVETEPWQ